jgi:Zn-dependent protease with chaperone function
MYNVGHTQQRTPASIQKCPKCGRLIPVYPGYVTWCDACEWNLEPFRARPRSIFEAFYRTLSLRLSASLFTDLVKQPVPRRTPTLSKLLAYTVALLVHALTGLLLFAGLTLLVTGWPNILALMIGVALLGVGAVSLPRVLQLRIDEGIAPRKDFPALYSVVDAIAKALGTTSIDFLVLDINFNSSFARLGWQRKKTIVLGLPLLSVLEGQERVALISHEMAHAVSGDPTRSLFVSTALNSLIRWYEILRPTERDYPVSLWMIPFDLLRKGLTSIVGLWVAGLCALMWRDMQRAEYLADYFAAAVSGTDAMISMLRKLHLSRAFEIAAHNLRFQNGAQDLFEELRRQVTIVPEREIDRLMRVEKTTQAGLDSTHPPTTYRSEFLEAHRLTGGSVMVPQSKWEKIDFELASARRWVHEKVLDFHAAQPFR